MSMSKEAIETKVELWKGHKITFLKDENGVWWALLDDIRKALGIKDDTNTVSRRINPDFQEKFAVMCESRVPIKHKEKKTFLTKTVHQRRNMTAVNENGVYEAIFNSNKLEARQFRKWVFEVLTKLRKKAGLDDTHIMDMMDPKIQERINKYLDDDRAFFDPERGGWLYSVTVPGGDVEQIRIEDVERYYAGEHVNFVD